MRIRSHGGSRRSAALTALALAVCALQDPVAGQGTAGSGPEAGARLPTGQRITPAGRQVPVGSMPIAADLSPDGRYLAVLQAGYETPSLSVLEVESGTLANRIELPDAWLGLTFHVSGDRLYASGGGRSSVWEISFRDGIARIEREFPLPRPCEGRCDALIGDLRFDADGRMLYALDVLGDRAVIVNTQSGLVLGEFRTGAAPYRARLAPDGKHLVVSHWGEASLGLYRLSDRRLVERIPVGEHPTDLLVVPGSVRALGSGRAGDEERSYPARLFAACAHSDNLWTFGIADSGRFDLLDVRSVAPFPGSPLGSLPSALGASADRSALYVANAGNNALLVADISEALPELSGAIPTGWFPTAAVGLPGGGLASLSGKGDGQRGGLVSILPALDFRQAAALSAAAVANLPSPRSVTADPPEAADHVLLALADASGESWEEALGEAAFLPGYAPPARGKLGQLAWLTGGMETDFFAKLAPAAASGRLTERALAAAGRAARAAAGTLWSNAADASVPIARYGIGGGRPVEAFLAELERGGALARLTVARLAGTSDDIGRLASAFREHPAYERAVLFAVPVGSGSSAAVLGGPVAFKGAHDGFVSAASVLRTIEWILGLRPMTQFDLAAPALETLFAPLR